MADPKSSSSFNYLDLKLTRYTPFLRLKKEGGKEYVFDPLRKKHLILQPEEFVRQLLIVYLHREHQVPMIRMKSEHSIQLYNTHKRGDLIVFNRDGTVRLLVECKSYKHSDTLVTLDQIEGYNLALKADKLLISNGPQSLFFSRNSFEEGFQSVGKVEV